MKIKPLSPTVGAEITNVDLSSNLSADQFDEIKNTFVKYGVIFFRDQNLTPAQHIAFAERWGDININRFFAAVKDYPNIAEVCKEPDQKHNIGSRWHTDHTYDQIPALGSILYARETPSVGGDTLFASMYAAYDALSDGLKQTLETLKAWHSSRHVFGEQAALDPEYAERLGNKQAATQDALHPVVITHPLSRRKSLYVNGDFTLRFDGWTQPESQALLDYLYAFCSQPEFVCRFQWKPGSMAFWDNRATWHKALNDYHGERRLMHRITIEGEALFPATG